MNETKFVSGTLEEVWELKKAVSREIENMTFEELRRYLDEGMAIAAKEIGARLVRKPDGFYRFVKESEKMSDGRTG